MYHDHLEKENTQFYLNDFVKQVRDNGLDYVGDGSLTSMYLGNMPAKVMETLKALDDVVAQEQYMDFITNRRFRSSILCKQGQKIDRNLQGEQIMDYYLSFNPAIQVIGFDPEKDITFKVGASEFKTHDKIAATLFMELVANGFKPIKAKNLVKNVQKKLKLDKPDSVEASLIANGLKLVLSGFMGLHSDSPDFVTEVSKKPVAYPVARYEAGLNGHYNKILTNVFSNSIPTDVTANIIVNNLDGTNTIEDILDVLVESVEKGVLNMQVDGKAVEDKAEIRNILQKLVERVMLTLARNAFLVG